MGTPKYDLHVVYISGTYVDVDDKDIYHAITRVVEPREVVRVRPIVSQMSKARIYLASFSNEDAKRKLLDERLLFVRDYVMRLEPSRNEKIYAKYHVANPIKLKLCGLPPDTYPIDLKEPCLDCKATFWEIPWSPKTKRFESFAIVEFASRQDSENAKYRKLALNGSNLVWQDHDENSDRERKCPPSGVVDFASPA